LGGAKNRLILPPTSEPLFQGLLGLSAGLRRFRLRLCAVLFHCSDLSSGMVPLLFLEALGFEFEGAAVFGDDADELVAGFVGQLGVNFESDGYFRAVLAGKMGDDFVGDATGVAAHARGIETNGSVESFGLWFGWRFPGPWRFWCGSSAAAGAWPW